MSSYRKHTRSLLLGATALVGSLALAATPAGAQERQYDFDVPAQPLESAVQAFARQAQQQVIFADTQMRGMKAPRLSGSYSADEGLAILLAGTGLEVRRTASGVLKIAADTDPQSGSAAGGGAEVEALIVTAQKREEDIQDVPIAISAFTQEDLTRSQVAGGPDLMTQVPNMTFTKTNFTSYSVQIRGIGTQAISATVDPAVAVAFNNTPFIRNRFFEQEFYDLQRIEVLRGPQGTLYGRNATAGVINMLTAKPAHRFEAKLSGDIANFSSTRLEGMVNLPLVQDSVALRLAGAWTKREGFATNQTTGNQIDGRDLWSTRLTLGFEPTDAIRAYLTWEHFEEDDDRLRSGKQLCKKDETPTEIGGVPVADEFEGGAFGHKSFIGQGCEAASLYSPDAFQTPNGRTLPFYSPLYNLGNPVFPMLDPYVSATQSRDLRVIESTIEPRYRAKADLAHLQLSVDISDALSVTSETAYGADFTWSTQDFSRFTTKSGAFDTESSANEGILDENGVFCDPQLGCSDTLLLADLATARSQQFSQEIRLSSDYDGKFNFNVGANFLRYDTEDKYYVFVNTLTMFAANWGPADGEPYVPGVTDNTDCLPNLLPGDTGRLHPVTPCVYIDPNPIESLNDQGHNYFLSRNPYRLISYAAFGEGYYNVAPSLKITAGLRYTVDKKRAPRIPSWVVGALSYGYPVDEVVDMEWREPTGRLAIDWKPRLAFTDETLLYASYARGYKAGGANPPPPAVTAYGTFYGEAAELVIADQLTHPRTFEPEFIDALEVGSKNTLLDGRLTLNLGAFYYDYQGYQISQIVNRSAINLNFDAEVWGAELEADWRPLDNLRLSIKGGYENTRLADGARAIDLMDRTAGDPNYIVIKNFPTLPSNCIVPVSFAAGGSPITISTCEVLFVRGESISGLDPSTVPNNGEGIFKDLSGNELPNAPHFTATFGADYTLPLPNEWLMTLHGDVYYQSEAWTRVFNTDGYDKLKAYTNVNFAAIFTNEDAGWKVMAYVKNVMDRDSITGAFLNSDDTGLTTNVFLTEPRLYGVRVTKDWSGGVGWLFASNAAGGAHPLVLEVGGSALRTSSDTTSFRPAFVEDFADPDLPFPPNAQNEELDWGDGREVKVSWIPATGKWSLSAAVRTAETNGSARMLASKEVSGGLSLPQWLIDLIPENAAYQTYLPGGPNYVREESDDREEHTIIEFSVGREVGLGAFSRSQVGVGLRYAQFESTSKVRMGGVADMADLPAEGVLLYSPFSFFHQNTAVGEAERRFEGTGPLLTWEASRALLENEDAGRLAFDLSVSGSVLFGKQDTRANSVAYTQFRRRFNGDGNVTTVSEDPAVSRSHSASERVVVPTLGASVGLSYEIDRIKVSGGYRIDRYFDVFDGGVAERREVDRTIEGPYFKVAVGFGG